MKGPILMTTNSPIIEAVLKTDWPLLRQQKFALVAAADKLEAAGDQGREHLDGIIQFLDGIQDAAAREVGIETVFGMSDAEEALAHIYGLLDGQSWNADTIAAIAEIVRENGFEIRSPEDLENNVE